LTQRNEQKILASHWFRILGFISLLCFKYKHDSEQAVKSKKLKPMPLKINTGYHLIQYKFGTVL